MANEAQVRISLNIDNAPLSYRSNPTGYTANVTNRNGPTPGVIVATTSATDVNLSELTSYGGYIWMQNLDPTDGTGNWVEYGTWDGSSFRPIHMLYPGEFSCGRLALNFSHDFGGGPGTGTTGGGVTLRFRSDAEPVRVRVDAFDP